MIRKETVLGYSSGYRPNGYDLQFSMAYEKVKNCVSILGGKEGGENSYRFVNLVQVSMCMYWKVIMSAATATVQHTLLKNLQEPEKVLRSIHEIQGYS